MSLKGVSIFLTGASGFIGTRLTECLVQAYGARVHAFFRRPGTSGVARLARLGGVKMFLGDVRDKSSVLEAAAGCSYMIHCAHGTEGGKRQQEEVTVAGTLNVLEAAASLGIRRVIHFSTASVHEPDGLPRTILEEDPLDGGFAYAQIKIQTEDALHECCKRLRVPFVILRPTCVWGPFSPVWTMSATELIRQGIPFLPLRGKGLANVVYIDSLVDAVVLALEREQALGEIFIINDDTPGTWLELYGGYANCLSLPLPLSQDPSESGERRWSDFMLKMAKNGIIVLRKIRELTPFSKTIWEKLPRRIQQNVKVYDAMFSPVQRVYASQCRYSNQKAKDLLGWRQRIGFENALDLTCQWLRYFYSQ